MRKKRERIECNKCELRTGRNERATMDGGIMERTSALDVLRRSRINRKMNEPTNQPTNERTKEKQ